VHDGHISLDAGGMTLRVDDENSVLLQGNPFRFISVQH